MWECGICCMEYSKDSRMPLALPCGHTVCKACVLNLQQQEQRCPECNCCIAGCLHSLPTNNAVITAVTNKAAEQPHTPDTSVASSSSHSHLASPPAPVPAEVAPLPSNPPTTSNQDASDSASAPAQVPEQSRPARKGGVFGLLQQVLRPDSSSSSGGDGGVSSSGHRDATVVQQDPHASNRGPLHEGMSLSEWTSMLLSSLRGSNQQIRAAEALLSFMQQPSGCQQLLAAGGIPTFSTLLCQVANSSANSTSSSSTGAHSTPIARQSVGSQEACSAVQHMAAAALQQMLQEQPECWQDVIAAGAVPALGALLKRPHSELSQQAAAAALETLTAADDDRAACAEAFAQASIVTPAVRLLLVSTNPAIQVSVAAMLTNLTAASDTFRTAAREAGGIPAALRALRSTPAGPPFAIVQEWALAFLSVAASTAIGAAEVCQAGGVVQIVRLLKSPCSAVRCNAARAICALAQNDTLACTEIESAGGIPALVQLLGSRDSNSKVLPHAVAALGWCMASSGSCAQAACSAGAVPVLMQLVSHGSYDVKQSAAAALEWAEAAGVEGGPYSLCSVGGGSEGERGLEGACQVPQQQLSERVSDWLNSSQLSVCSTASTPAGPPGVVAGVP